MTTVYKLRQNEDYTDVTLQSDDVHIRCHRVVLAVASEYFKAIFRCGIEENASDTVQLTMDPNTLTSIIDYIYTGEIELTVDNVERLVVACDVLQLDGLKAGCEDFMVAQLELTNCVKFYRLAESYRLCGVQTKSRQLILAEFESVASTDHFKKLSCSELIELIKDDDLGVHAEDVVFECVLDWVRYDIDNRKSFFESILQYVRLPYCSGPCLRHMEDTCDMLSPKCLEYLHEAKSFQLDTAHQHNITSSRAVPRNNFRTKLHLLVVGGMVVSKKNKVVEKNICQYYNEDTSCWELMTEMPQSVGRYYSVCRIEGGLLVTGGQKGGRTTNKCWFYDLATKKWEAMPRLITARDSHRCVSLGGCVYVMGGFDEDGDVLDSVECLNRKRQEWHPMPDMPEAVYASMVVAYGNKIFVFGGVDDQDTSLRCTQKFDTRRRKWRLLSNMPVACDRIGAVTMNDSIYVVGGQYRTCLKYEPATDTWTKLSRPRERHNSAPAVVWRGCILVAGGGDGKPESSAIEAYDPLTDMWSKWKSELNLKMYFHEMLNVDLHGV